jgi:hypothetical protein
MYGHRVKREVIVKALDRIVLSGLLALASTACGGGSSGPEPLRPIDFRTDVLLSDDNEAFPDSVTVVVTDATRFGEIWSQSMAPSASPAVDFEREMIVVVAIGRMTPGDAVAVDSAGVREIEFASGSSQDVLMLKGRIIRDCTGFEGASYPYQILKVQRFDGPVQVDLARVTSEGCDSFAGLTTGRGTDEPVPNLGHRAAGT